jgi:hypothetical protein
MWSCESYGSHVEYLDYFFNWIKRWQSKRTEKESSDVKERLGKIQERRVF